MKHSAAQQRRVTTPSRAVPSARPMTDQVPWWFLALFAVVQLLTMPGMNQPADNLVPRIEAANICLHGTWSIDYDHLEQAADFTEVRGQFFYFRDDQRQVYSKYGVGYTAVYLPLFYLHRIFFPEFAQVINSRSMLLLINLLNVGCATLVASYLFRMARWYVEQTWLAIVFVVAVVYSTILWHYLRSPALDVYQLLAFVALVFHSRMFLQLRGDSRVDAAWRELWYASLWFGWLLLMRSSYAVIPPMLAIAFVALDRAPNETWTTAAQRWMRQRWQLFRYGVLPMSVAVGVMLWTNHLKFGSPFNTGYMQWLDADGTPNAEFSWRFIPQACRAFFWTLGNYNLFTHAPLVLFAFLGYPAFIRHARRDALLCAGFLAAVVAPLLCYEQYHGEWCYGPRYLVPIMPLVTLPVVFVLQRWSHGRSTSNYWRWGALVSVLLVSFYLQCCVNLFHYFAYQNARDYCSVFRNAEVKAYFERSVHRGLICHDLLLFRLSVRAFPPLQIAASNTAADTQQLCDVVADKVRLLTTTNSFFVSSPLD
jgi:hypothetical protein